MGVDVLRLMVRTQHQIAHEVHADICLLNGLCGPEPCPNFEQILAALREQSLLTRAQVIEELEARARRWPMYAKEVRGCIEAIRADAGKARP